MEFMELIKSIFILLLISLASCALQKTPTGGEKDTLPPQVSLATPLPMSTGFTAEKIEIEFDEYVQLQNAREQVLISPPLDEAPEISLKGGRKLVIDFLGQTLRENTTYTVNLGEAIKDNNEGNLLEENVYLFSTGDFIDTLELSGSLTRANYGDPCAGCFALLYPDAPDSTVLSERPYYLAKANGQGEFLLSNLAGGEYRLVALDDGNSDLLISEGESMGFMEGLISPLALDTFGVSVDVFQPAGLEKGLKSFDWSIDGRTLSIVTEGLDSLPDLGGEIAGQIAKIEELDGREDSLRIWFLPAIASNDEILFLGPEVTDTLRAGRVTPPEEEKNIIRQSRIPDPESPLELDFTLPIKSIDTSLVKLIRDSLSIPYSIDLSETPIMGVELEGDFKNGRYILEILPGALVDIYGNQNDTLKMAVKCPSIESFGNLSLNLNFEDKGTYLIELLDKNRKVLRSTSTDSSLTWSNTFLNPGDYFLRVFSDLDGNSLWTTGDFQVKRQPEPVYMLLEPIVIRANWDVEQEVEVRFKP